MINILFENRDLKYKKFHSRLIPNIEPERVIGVRTPVLRKIAQSFRDTEERSEFLKILPHMYYEENNLHAFFIEQITDFDECVCELNRFLPYVDNWATCDSMRPKCFKKNKEKLIAVIKEWIKSEDVYTVRFSIEMLMVYYLDDEFRIEYPELVGSIQSEEYYINMMIAWYFATALAKQWDDTFAYIKDGRLSLFVHNKTIQKAIESYRISESKKKILRGLKRKG